MNSDPARGHWDWALADRTDGGGDRPKIMKTIILYICLAEGNRSLERSRLRRRLLSLDLDRLRRVWRDDGERERLLLRLLGDRDLDLEWPIAGKRWRDTLKERIW